MGPGKKAGDSFQIEHLEDFRSDGILRGRSRPPVRILAYPQSLEIDVESSENREGIREAQLLIPIALPTQDPR
jgi:hypothetical protein